MDETTETLGGTLEQPAGAAPQPDGIAWGDAISPERLEELKELFTRQKEWAAQPERDSAQSVFNSVTLTGAEVFWLGSLVLAGTSGNLDDAATRLRERLVVYNISLSALHLQGAHLTAAQLQGAHLTGASFDKTSRLYNAQLDGVHLDQMIFDNTNLTVVPWEAVKRLGDEHSAGAARGASAKADAFHAAARAYRSLAVALRNQGLGADATRFHFRSELMERKSSWWRIWARLFSRQFYTAPVFFGRWLFSWVLGTFAGYDDYFGRLLVTYLLTVGAFAAAMFVVSGRAASPDTIRDVLVLSITSFHGRGVQPPGLPLAGVVGDALATLTAIEAFFGLFIEGIFIAAFTRQVTGN
jgi:pentapeptide repeat protein